MAGGGSETGSASGAASRPLEGDRRVVTVLFADLSGFTRLGEQLDPEELTALLRECLGELMEEVRAREGWLEKQIGDALLAVFGAPITHEDDPVRAVQAALAMQVRMASLNDRVGQRIGQTLSLHIGVNTGLVVMGPGIERIHDEAERGDFIVVGDTVNTGARLQQAADAGQILVGESTYVATRGSFEYRNLPPLTAKGKGQQIVVYRCLGARPATRSARGLASPLVGREEQFALVTGAVEALLAGRGGIVFVTGEAGLGKSRLVTEASRRLDGTRLLWLEGRALSFGQTISYWPFLELIRSYAGISEDDGEVEGWSKLEDRLSSLVGDEIGDFLPYLATLLALRVQAKYAERVDYLDAEAMGRQIFRAARRFFERLALERPLVLVFEDWHWADESSTELLEHLMPLSAATPLLIVCVSRPEAEGPAARLRDIGSRDYADRCTEIRLTPLSTAASVQLIQNLLDPDELPEQVASPILEKAEGNPFFVEEILRALIDVGAVTRDETRGRWQVASDPNEMAIPNTLRGVIVARIDRLEEDLKELLRIASVMGRSFLYSLLRAIDEADEELDQHLAELQRLELIRERRRIPELEYIFKHALTQEAIYESILLERRRGLHRRVAELIEALLGDRLDESYGLLAHHYARAEDWEKAQEYLFRAGDQAATMAADSEALRHYEAALAAYSRAFGDRWDPFQRAQLERKVGEALFRRGEHEQAIQYLRRALAYLGSPYPRSRWGVRLALGRAIARQLGHRLAPRLVIKQGADRADVAAEERYLAYEAMGWIDYFLDQERLLLDVLLMLDLCERTRLSVGVARGSAAVGIALDLSGLPRLAGRYHRRAVDLAEQIRHPVAIGLAYLGRGVHEYLRAEIDTALEDWSRAAAVYRDAGELRGWGAATAMISWAMAVTGHLSESLKRGEEILHVGQEAGDIELRSWGQGQMARILWHMGAVEEGMSRADEALDLAKAIPDYLNMAGILSDIGRCYLYQGKLEQARASLEEGERLIDERGLRGFVITQNRTALAECYLRTAELSAGAERSRALKKAKRACRAALKHSKAVRDAVPGACRVQGTYRWLGGHSRAARRWWQRSLRAAEALGARYELGLMELEMGRRLGQRVHLERAEAIFSEIGAGLDLAVTRDLLAERRLS